jgi:hypothetical protein
MAKRAQEKPHLRCSACDGYGWVPVMSIADRSHQAGEEVCKRCGGDGNKRDVLHAVKVRKLPKQKTVTLQEFDEEVRRWAHGRKLVFKVAFNDEDWDHSDYGGYVWLSPQDKEKAIDEGSVWTLEIFGFPDLCIDSTCCPP